MTDTLSSYISICRTLGAVDGAVQLYLEQMLDAFRRHNQQPLLMKFIVHGLGKWRKSIPVDVFDDISQLFHTDEQLCINDSITSSGTDIAVSEKEDEAKRINFLSIPKDLTILTFTFLSEKDRTNAGSVCRCFCVTSRNPNAVYHVARLPSQRDKALLPVCMYSRVRAAAVTSVCLVDPKWYRTLVKLDVDRMYMWRYDPPSHRFMNLQHLTASSNDFVKLTKAMDVTRLFHLRLSMKFEETCWYDSDEEEPVQENQPHVFMIALSECINLKTLALTSYDDSSDDAASPETLYSSTPNLLNKLHSLDVEYNTAKHHAQLIEWII